MENPSRMKKFGELCELHQHLVSVADTQLRQILTTTAINLQDYAGIASLSDMVFTIQCGLCPELVEFFHRYVQGREANCLIHTGFQFISLNVIDMQSIFTYVIFLDI